MQNNIKENSFVHLHLHTEYSLLDGAARIDMLADSLKNRHMNAVAITDHGSMYGVPHFCKILKKAGIKPIVGCEVYLAPTSRFEKNSKKEEPYYHLVLLVESEIGYKNLIKLVSAGFTEGFYRKPRIDKEILSRHAEGLIALSACLQGEVANLLMNDEKEKAENAALEYLQIFGKDNFFLEVEDHGIHEQKVTNPQIVKLAQKYGIGLVATNDVHYLEKSDAEAHDVLLCIQTATTVDAEKRMRFPSNNFYLKTIEEMQLLFPQEEFPDALSNTVKIAERCSFEMEFGNTYLPDFPVPSGLSEDMYLAELCAEGFKERYGGLSKEKIAQAKERLRYELDIIVKMNYAGYFLIVWDFICYARKNDIAVGPGRGSAAGSIVAYLLRITDIEPLEYDLLFERFLNPERISMPDIDTDICYERRGEVVEYIRERYGRDHVCQIITFGTMAARAAIRDVGRAMNIPYSDVDRIAKMVPQELGMTLKKAMETNSEFRELMEVNRESAELLKIAMALEGMPRHASVHAAGVVVAKEPLTNYLPIQTMTDGAIVTQFDMGEIESIGLLKMDLLGLRTLTVIAETIKLINSSRTNDKFDISTIPLQDKKTGKMLSNGETEGVFQMESSGMTKLVRDLQPHAFEDMIPLVALYRPGPLESGMVGDFIDGQHGKKNIKYMHELLEPVLSSTFGVILYQEQVMRIASDLAGFSLGQADLLRKAMGKKKPEVIAAEKGNFVAGAAKKGIATNVAAEIFDTMAHFAGYGFNKSHSAAYALVAYQTAFLKANYTKEFMAALLTSVTDDSAKVGYYIEVCRKMHIPVLPPDINTSEERFAVENKGIRFGLTAVRNVGEQAVKGIIKARKDNGDFTSLLDFCSRVEARHINKRVVENLIKCGAFDSLGGKRSQYLLTMEESMNRGFRKQQKAADLQISLFDAEEIEDFNKVDLPEVPELQAKQLLAYEKEITGFYITGHPLDEYKHYYQAVTSINKLAGEEYQDGMQAGIGGMITAIKHILTKKGDSMCVLTCEDFSGQIEMVVFPKIFAANNKLLAVDNFIYATTKLQKDESTVKLIAENIVPLSDMSVVLKIMQGETPAAEITEILKKHHGSIPVLLYNGGRVPILLKSEKWVSCEQALIDSLAEKVGANSLKWDAIKTILVDKAEKE